jgi:hypothetical protein
MMTTRRLRFEIPPRKPHGGVWTAQRCADDSAPTWLTPQDPKAGALRASIACNT